MCVMKEHYDMTPLFEGDDVMREIITTDHRSDRRRHLWSIAIPAVVCSARQLGRGVVWSRWVSPFLKGHGAFALASSAMRRFTNRQTTERAEAMHGRLYLREYMSRDTHV